MVECHRECEKGKSIQSEYTKATDATTCKP